MYTLWSRSRLPKLHFAPPFCPVRRRKLLVQENRFSCCIFSAVLHYFFGWLQTWLIGVLFVGISSWTECCSLHLYSPRCAIFNAPDSDSDCLFRGFDSGLSCPTSPLFWPKKLRPESDTHTRTHKHTHVHTTAAMFLLNCRALFYSIFTSSLAILRTSFRRQLFRLR